MALLYTAKGEKEEALSLVKKHNLEGLTKLTMGLTLNSLLGNKMEVYEWIENGLENGFNPYLPLIRNPLFDPFRDDPEFQEIVEKAKARHDEYLRKYTSVILPEKM